MASEALNEIIAGMRENGPDFSAPPPEARAAFEALLAGLPMPDGAACEPVKLGGIAGLRHGGEALSAGAILYLHGGGYVVGSAAGYRGLAVALGEAAGAVLFAIDYRLAPEHPFPAAIEDAVAAFHALCERGYDPRRIAIAGDSAGGGLAVATMLRLREMGLPLPGAGLLLSPWADLACSGASIAQKAAADPSLDEAALRAMAAHYLAGTDAAHPLASPVNADLAGLPPLLIQVGSSEILFDDAVRLARAAGAANVGCRLEIWPEMIHVWHAFAFMLPEGRAAITAAGAFLRERLDDDRGHA